MAKAKNIVTQSWTLIVTVTSLGIMFVALMLVLFDAFLNERSAARIKNVKS